MYNMLIILGKASAYLITVAPSQDGLTTQSEYWPIHSVCHLDMRSLATWNKYTGLNLRDTTFKAEV